MICYVGVDQHPLVWIEGEICSLCVHHLVVLSFIINEESWSILRCAYIEKLDIFRGSHC